MTTRGLGGKFWDKGTICVFIKMVLHYCMHLSKTDLCTKNNVLLYIKFYNVKKKKEPALIALKSHIVAF